MWLTFLSLVVASLGLFFFWWIWRFSYWKRRGFPFLEPVFPMGSLRDMVLFKRYQGTVIEEAYKRLDPHPYGGVYLFHRPAILLRDPEIIKHVMLKNFSHFRDRLEERMGDSVFFLHLFFLTGDKWRALRTKLAPTFTSGKLKEMFRLFKKCSKNLDSILQAKADKGETLDMKDFMARFTTDIIASCAFGLEINSIDNPDVEFREMAQNIFPPVVPFDMKLKLATNLIFPFIQKIYTFPSVHPKVSRFIYSVVKDTVDFREKNKVKRHDFLDLLLELKHKGSVEAPLHELDAEDVSKIPVAFDMTMDLLVAQCFVFLAAGFETSSSVMTYCFYELALNPDIQERLRKEIDEEVEKEGGLTYQAIQNMRYLDQVISETIRKYPTLPILTRVCTRRYKMPDSGLVVEEGTRMLIPSYALQHDPKYFPEPDKFDPDRFSPERKSSIVPFTYLPFGEGPRLCIGMRFGLLQTKMGICTVLAKYELSRAPETVVPLRFSSTPLISITGHSVVLKIERRNNDMASFIKKR